MQLYTTWNNLTNVMLSATSQTRKILFIKCIKIDQTNPCCSSPDSGSLCVWQGQSWGLAGVGRGPEEQSPASGLGAAYLGVSSENSSSCAHLRLTYFLYAGYTYYPPNNNTGNYTCRLPHQYSLRCLQLYMYLIPWENNVQKILFIWNFL